LPVWELESKILEKRVERSTLFPEKETKSKDILIQNKKRKRRKVRETTEKIIGRDVSR
jgi:hypothetical protein